MAGTYADLFGGRSSGGDRTPFFKYEETGDEYLLVQTGPHTMHAQTIEVKRVRMNKWLVQRAEGDKWEAIGAGPNFQESDYFNAFQPEKEIRIPVKVMNRRGKDGKQVENFEPYDALWDLAAGDLTQKLQDAMLESDVPAIEGTRYVTKRLSTDSKPYKYSIRMKAGE